MEREPFLASESSTHRENLIQEEEVQFKPPQYQVIFEDMEDPFLGGLDSHSSSNHLKGPASSVNFRPPNGRKKSTLLRSKSAPAMERRGLNHQSQNDKPYFESNSVVRQVFLLLILYLFLGVTIYSFNQENFTGIKTHPVVDALYFCIVTLCTIGNGDIAPSTPAIKVFACVFVLVGFGFVYILLTGVVKYVLDLQKNIDVEKGSVRIRMKVGLALGVVILFIGMGAMVLYFVENLDLIDSIYLSVMSVTTVGNGGRAFTTLPGRLFASFWLLFSTLAVARAFLYLAEARIDKRNRKITKWVLHRDISITVEDFIAADIDNNGFISKSEYVIFKLKEMGKINENDILQISNQFNKLDPNNTGKITLPDLLDI